MRAVSNTPEPPSDRNLTLFRYGKTGKYRAGLKRVLLWWQPLRYTSTMQRSTYPAICVSFICWANIVPILCRHCW